MRSASLPSDFFAGAQALDDEATHHSSPMERRQSVLVRTSDIGSGELWASGKVTALSPKECHVTVDGRFAQGTSLEVMFPGFAPRVVQVVWTGDDAIRCRFAAPLPVAILDYLLHMSDGTVLR